MLDNAPNVLIKAISQRGYAINDDMEREWENGKKERGAVADMLATALLVCLDSGGKIG